MKIIDLLNKVANDEEVPETIKYSNYVFKWTGLNYYCEKFDKFLDSCIALEDLRYPVEIIEEKEIEELSGLYMLEGNDSAMPTTLQDFNNQDILKKINELVRELNQIKKEGVK